MSDEKDPKEKNIVNPNDNFKNIISSYLLSQMNQDKDDPSKKPNNTKTEDQKKTTRMRVTGLRQFGDTKSKLKNSIRNRRNRYA